MICIENVEMQFKKKKILSNLNYEFPSTGFYIICGKSGVGKTTLLNILTGLLKPTCGTVKYDGVDIYDKNYKKRTLLNEKIGYIFQNYNLIEELSVEDNIRLGNSCENQEILDIMKFLGIEDLKDEKVEVLSGGERQRTAIARAIIKSPSILIADEPTGNLDEDNSKIIMQYLAEISKTTLVIMVTHDVSLAKNYASHILYLSRQGIKDEVLTNVFDANMSYVKKESKASSDMSFKMNFKLLWATLYKKKVLFLLYMILFIVSMSLSAVTLSMITFDKADLASRVISKYNPDKEVVEVIKIATYENKFTHLQKGKIFFEAFDNKIIGKRKKFKDIDYIQVENFDAIPLEKGRVPIKEDEVIVTHALAELDTLTIMKKEYRVVGITSAFEESQDEEKFVFGLNTIKEDTSILTTSLFSAFESCYYHSANQLGYTKDIAINEIVVSKSYAMSYNLKEGQVYTTCDVRKYKSDYFNGEINPYTELGETFIVKEILDQQDFFVILNDDKYESLSKNYDFYYDYEKTVLIHKLDKEFIEEIYKQGFDIIDENLMSFDPSLSILNTYNFFGRIILVIAIILFIVSNFIFLKSIIFSFRNQFSILKYLGIKFKYMFSQILAVNGVMILVTFVFNTLFTMLILILLNKGLFANLTEELYKTFNFLNLRMDILGYLSLALILTMSVLSAYYLLTERNVNIKK
ncbi:MAG: ABC transporter ATP-binding protein [Roseburia sp.]|nr:ABC transporter ATP-binding protein [Anaeroplasma bactoclasticum]MCM1196838.1 ABC transporter ATP-binding protein [Roseburia sp.]MCM1557036.1 ABC transporter ATP-binding protein [Anaeroplasma bactoclasticum]